MIKEKLNPEKQLEYLSISTINLIENKLSNAYLSLKGALEISLVVYDLKGISVSSEKLE